MVFLFAEDTAHYPMCLASIGKQYARPDWFFEKLAEVLAENVHEELSRSIGKQRFS